MKRFKSVTLGLLFFIHISLFSTYAAVQFESSNLPIVVIDTHGKSIPDEYRIVADMGIIYNGPGQRNYLNQPFNHFQGKIAIELRGSSSQMFPKKQYALETQTESGENLNVSLLGLPAENDWILYAPYSDKSLIRNVLIYQLSREMGQYASRTRFCELVLNGDYRGVYVLMEKIKRDKHRVNISKLKPDETTGDDVTGGYILKIDKMAGEEIDGWQSIFPPYPQTTARIFYQYHYPKPDRIVSAQKAYIQNWIFNFEKTFYANTFMEAEEGYYRFVDLASFVDFFILNEISRNVDGYRLSSFMYKDRDDKDPRLHMGPIWDFNLAFGNADYYHGFLTSGWQVNFNHDPQTEYDPFKVPFWWEKMLSDSVFMKQLINRYGQLRESTLALEHLNQLIDAYADTLSEAQIRNFERWPVLGQYVWPNYFIGNSYEEEIQFLKNWIAQRLDWIDSQLFDEQPPSAPRFVSLVSIDHSSATLSWGNGTDNVGVAGYDVYLDGRFILPVRSVNATITDLLDDQEYTVSIRSRDFAGNRSQSAATLKIKTEPFTSSDGIIAPKTEHPFNIDGQAELAWQNYQWHTVEKVLMGSVENSQDLSARFKIAWDDQYIYLLVDIVDDVKIRDSGDNLFLDDDLEIYFDMDNSKSSAYGMDDFRYRLTLVDSVLVETQFRATQGVRYKVLWQEDGYLVEMAFPWSVLGCQAKNGKLIGFDLQINDDDDGGIRDAKIGWWAAADYARPSFFGQVKMKRMSTALPETNEPLPTNFAVLRAFPNPFNGDCKIELHLNHRAEVQLELFSVAGQRIATLYKGFLLPGRKTFKVNFSNLASGIYFVNLTDRTKGSSTTARLVLIR